MRQLKNSVAKIFVLIFWRFKLRDVGKTLNLNNKYWLYQNLIVFKRIRKNYEKVTITFVLYVCRSVIPHGITRLPLDGFSLNLISFMKVVIPVVFYEITNVECVYSSNTTIFIGRI